MIYYMIRHKETGEFMPELKRTRGYSWWNPGKVPTIEVFQKKKLTGTPRLFAFRRTAARSIALWAACANSRAYQTTDYDGNWDEYYTFKEDGRKRKDLEVVEVNIEVV